MDLITPICDECGLPMERDTAAEAMFHDMIFWICYCTWVSDGEDD